MKAIIIGIPGVGKTTVLKEASKQLPKYETVNFGTKMLETAKKREIVEDRDQLRKLSPEKTKKLQKETAKKMKKKKKLLIDTHLAIETPKGIVPGIPKWVAEKIKPDRIILIEAEPNEIRSRRKKDKTRKRSDFTLPPEQHQKLNRYYAASISTITGAVIKIIKNKPNKSKKAGKELVKTMKE